MARVAEIRAIERKDGRSFKYGISYPQAGKPAKRVFKWKTKASRDMQLANDRRMAATDGTAALTITPADIQLLSELREMLPENVDPREAVRFYLKHNLVAANINLSDAIRAYLHNMQIRRLAQEYISHTTTELNYLQDVIMGDRDIGEISGTEMQNLFARMKFAPRTKDNYRDHYARFFRWCIKSGWLHRSPMDAIGNIQVAETEPNVMPVSDVLAMMRKCQEIKPHAAPFLALSFFAGMRSTQITRMRCADFNFEERGINMPAERGDGSRVTKAGKRFYVEGHEDNLWAWLEPLREPWKPFSNSAFRDWRQQVYLSAQVDYPHNGGRDSFCSYHIALYNDGSRTATLLTHRSVDMQYQHYRGKALKRDAIDYFRIMP